MGSDQALDWRIRREAIRWWYRNNPSTPSQAHKAVEIYRPEVACSRYEVAARHIARLERKGEIRLIGRFFKDVGRPENVHYCDDLRADLVRHEVLVSQFILDFRPENWVRLWNVDKRFHADVEMWSGDESQRMFVELDTGETEYARIWAKFRLYGKSLGDQASVMWVCLTEHRMKGMMRRVELLRGKGLFTVLGSGQCWDMRTNR